MRRFSWTKTTMVLAEVGGAYVTYHDHQRAMAEKDAEIDALREKVDATSDLAAPEIRLRSKSSPYQNQISKPQCPICFGHGNSTHCGPCIECGARRVVHSEGSACGCVVCSGKPKPFMKLYKCNTCKDTGCTDCY